MTAEKTEDSSVPVAEVMETLIEGATVEEKMLLLDQLIQEIIEEEEPKGQSRASMPEVISVIREVNHHWNGLDECLVDRVILTRN